MPVSKALFASWVFSEAAPVGLSVTVMNADQKQLEEGRVYFIIYPVIHHEGISRDPNNGGPSVQIHDPLGDISHSNHDEH